MARRRYPACGPKWPELLKFMALGMSPNCRPSRILDYLSREQVRATWRKAVICLPRQNVAQPVLCSFRARRGGVPVVLAASRRPPPRSYSLKSEFARNSACCTVFECQIPTRRISHPTTPQVRWGENTAPENRLSENRATYAISGKIRPEIVRNSRCPICPPREREAPSEAEGDSPFHHGAIR